MFQHYALISISEPNHVHAIFERVNLCVRIYKHSVTIKCFHFRNEVCIPVLDVGDLYLEASSYSLWLAAQLEARLGRCYSPLALSNKI